TFVANGNTYYYGNNGYSCSSGPGYEPLSIAATSNKVQFKLALEAHQQGKTSFVVFCNDCARLGIERWVVCTEKMTCTYFNKAGQELLVEPIRG
ncbi:MAG TPA: DUF1398 family protein, partial [Chitinophagaceae bacterium]|nr:DUF1398 family protein [Chitinophagaceae bacterium]